MTTHDGRFLDDALSLKAIINSLPAASANDYREYGALELKAAFPNRRMIIYTLKGGMPIKMELLTFGDIQMTRFNGPEVEVVGSKGSEFVGVRPFKWDDRDLFLHIPQNFVFKWKGKETKNDGVHFVPHYAILVKTLSKEHHQVEGHTYCATFNEFNERFPAKALKY